MTAEIAILNKSAVALAADSAVTVSRFGKIYNSANKLFGLSRFDPVGIMIYGSASLVGVPWETIIKIYRSEKHTRHATLQEYAEEFMQFLDKANPLMFPAEEQSFGVYVRVKGIFENIDIQVNEEVSLRVSDPTPPLDQATTPVEVYRQTLKSTLDKKYAELQSLDQLKGLPTNWQDQILAKYKDEIDRSEDKVFKARAITEEHRKQLRQVVAESFSRKTDGESGVVVAGFGRDEVFPSLFSYTIDDIVSDRLLHAPFVSLKVSHDEPAKIMPFAQMDVVSSFVFGCSPNVPPVSETKRIGI